MYLQIETGTADKRKSDLKNSFAVHLFLHSTFIFTMQIETGTADKRKSDLKNSFAVIEAQHKVIASTLHSLNTKP